MRQKKGPLVVSKRAATFVTGATPTNVTVIILPQNTTKIKQLAERRQAWRAWWRVFRERHRLTNHQFETDVNNLLAQICAAIGGNDEYI